MTQRELTYEDVQRSRTGGAALSARFNDQRFRRFTAPPMIAVSTFILLV